MDLLRKELAKREAEAQRLAAAKGASASTASAPAAAAPPKKKFVKRGELEQLKQAQEQAERREKEARKAAEEAEAAARFQRSKPPPGVDADEAVPLVELPLDEVIKRLRRYGKPITLFGEDEAARRARLKVIEDEGLDDLALHGGHNLGNVFLKDTKDELRYDSDEDDDDDGKGEGSVEDGDGAEPSAKKHKANGSAEAGSGGGGGAGGKGGELMTLPEWFAFAKAKGYSKEQYVAKFFKQVIREWEQQLARRPDSVKHTAAGRIETMTEKQCKDYMRPFFRRCKKKELGADILEHIWKIVNFCEEREYVKAGDQYVQLAIGNAPWPMGVTSVGIHDRAARTKIFASNVAHVMNDEFQRKYITSIKRLMTQCQHLYPTDPSKMMM